ncbi:DUF305 domain-containing protein [Streptomyces sp. NPDC004546]|uniref:DUF305 domain-containing protein n=1 Tax=unclassified Streptomyces TaxID=2593676 RepID=UPI0033A6DADA
MAIHQQAAELSFIVRDRARDEDIRRLAYDVINIQANQRGMLLSWLVAWDQAKFSQQPRMSWMKHLGWRAWTTSRTTAPSRPAWPPTPRWASCARPAASRRRSSTCGC